MRRGARWRRGSAGVLPGNDEAVSNGWSGADNQRCEAEEEDEAMTTQRWQEEAMPTPPGDSIVSQRARAVAQGLIRTGRAEHHGVFDRGMLKLRGRKGGNYWVSLDGSRLLRGRELFEAEELHPGFIDVMERASR